MDRVLLLSPVFLFQFPPLQYGEQCSSSMVARACNSSTWEATAGVRGQYALSTRAAWAVSRNKTSSCEELQLDLRFASGSQAAGVAVPLFRAPRSAVSEPWATLLR